MIDALGDDVRTRTIEARTEKGEGIGNILGDVDRIWLLIRNEGGEVI